MRTIIVRVVHGTDGPNHDRWEVRPWNGGAKIAPPALAVAVTRVPSTPTGMPPLRGIEDIRRGVPRT